jgi:hypothetical protein
LGVELLLEVFDLSFKHEDATDPCEGHPLAGHLGDGLYGGNLGAGVTALAAFRARGLYDLLGVQLADEGRLDPEDPATWPTV